MFYLGHKTLVLEYFAEQSGTNFPIFDQKPWSNPFRKMQNFLTFLIHVFEVLHGYSSIYKLTKHFVLEYFAEKKEQDFKFLTINHGLSSLEMCQYFSTFSNRRFFSLKWLDFYLQGHTTLCFGLFAEKQKRTKFPIFY